MTRAFVDPEEVSPEGPVSERISGVTEASRARGYEDGKAQLNARLRRIEGQIRGLQRMVDEGEYCIDILTQISAAQAALRKVALVLLDDHLRRCVLGTSETEDQRLREVMEATARLLRSG